MKEKKKLKLAAVEQQAPAVEVPTPPVSVPGNPEAPKAPALRDRAAVEQEYNNILFDIGGKHFAISRTQQMIKEQEAKANSLLIEIQMIELQANLKAAHNKPQEV